LFYIFLIPRLTRPNRASPAEQCPVEDGSVQLVNACVAAHWFDLPAFFKESDRILCSNGIVAIAAYVPLLEFVHPTASEELGEAMKLVRTFACQLIRFFYSFITSWFDFSYLVLPSSSSRLLG
jgi:ubiquinone/menaquinone biosynthesis C-methylase UbiE